ncbi:hypothetical protein ACJRO7_032307 [Eucalyptus globulus]|uniref:TIR domain-containing protein n=1 Tax=Eucalyptus globulus TaxID=34317 RepID=A0ABD3JKR6_EUCGL
MAWKDLPYLAAAAFAAILFRLFSRGGDQARSMERSAKRRQGEQATSMERSAKRRCTGGNDGTAGGASSTHTSTEGQEVATSLGYDYEVFLSFRGPDTRAGFTDFLYTSLKDAGIRTFRDDEELREGEEFGPELLQAFEQSKISIPIFSKGYASSVWCLKELVKMVECQKTKGQKIVPIFYDVAPSEVRHLTGGYGKAFHLHENKKRHDEKIVQEWKDALTVVGQIKGLDLQSMSNRREGEFAREVTQKVFRELKKAYLAVSKCLVNVDNHVDAIMEMIGAGTSETRIIGIHGMGGIGKTTTAKMIYNKLSYDFQNCCFLGDIRARSKYDGIQCLQNQLISDILEIKFMYINHVHEGTHTIEDRLFNKRVLLLLDDVEEDNHINALVGKRDWLGRGSKILITTRNKDVLNVPEVDCSYELSGMDLDQSLQLFSRHAFRKDYPLDEYIGQSKRAIGIARGLPLALEVIGSLLCRTKKEKWDLTLKKLENVPHVEIQSKLKISYDTLDVRQQDIFLDIACLFIGYDKDIVVHFWDESKFPEEAIEVLQNMSLIKIIEDNKVWMHDQFRDLGREIVRQESNTKIKEQSRVWDSKEGLDLLSHKGQKKVEALCLKLDHQGQYCLTFKDFERLPNLRFLEVDGWTENLHFKRRHLSSKSNVFQENSYLLPQLRWLSWHDIPPTFKITNFSMEDVVILDLSGNQITQDWNGWSHMKVINNLKVLNLTNCWYLERTPNLSAHANLECLILRGCSKLVEIDGSIYQLKCLVSLDVTYCSDLRRLPDKLGGLEALKELRIDWTPIKEIPDCQGMSNLRIFSASGCGITTLPLSIGGLASLECVSLKGCRCLKRLPDSIGNWESLIELDLSWTSIKELPNSMGNLKNLKLVKMTGSCISKIPDALWTIEKLEEIIAADNRCLRVEIGNGIYGIPWLRILRLKCAEIYTIPKLPESLTNLYLSKLDMKKFPDLSNLINLKELDLRFGPRHDDGKSYGLVEDPMPWWIGKLSKLKYLGLECDYMTTLPTDISLLPQLRTLDLHCFDLRCLPRLPSSLSSLSLHNCMSLRWMDLSNLEKLSSLMIRSSSVSDIRGLDCLENLQNLRISDLGQVEMLPDLCDLNKLRGLDIRSCSNLVDVQGSLPQSLEELEICSCESLQKLPHLLSLKRLQKIVIEDCVKLNVEAILGFAQRSQAKLWESLQNLRISDLGQVEKLPDLSILNKLSSLDIRSCSNLVEIQGKLPQSLEELGICSCQSLRKLPDLSGLNELQRIDINDCMKLNVDAILGSARRNRRRSAPWS